MNPSHLFCHLYCLINLNVKPFWTRNIKRNLWMSYFIFFPSIQVLKLFFDNRTFNRLLVPIPDLNCIPHNIPSNCQNNGKLWILSQSLSSIHKKNIGSAGDQTSHLLFSSPVCYRLSYGAQQKSTHQGEQLYQNVLNLWFRQIHTDGRLDRRLCLPHHKRALQYLC